MKNSSKSKILAVAMCAAMAFSMCGTAFAAGKPAETVYALLEADGSAREIIVKNGVNEKLDVKGELPFNVKISYKFDGKSMKPQEMLGQGAGVEITVEITPNSKTKAYYKENLALQMQFPIDMSDEKAQNLKGQGLTGVTVGAIKTLSGIVLPGKSAKYVISYKTSFFEMQSINFVCMPFDMSGTIDIDMSEITTQITDLQTGVAQYVAGVSQAGDGVVQANTGLKKLAANGKKLADGVAQASGGANALIQAMLAAMPPEQQAAFAPKLQEMQAGQKQMSDSLNAYTKGVSQASAGLNKIAEGTAELVKGGITLRDGIDAAVAPLMKMPGQTQSTAAAESFISTDGVSEIQFVMKTDELSAAETKADVQPDAKPKATFWSRLMALFGM